MIYIPNSPQIQWSYAEPRSSSWYNFINIDHLPWPYFLANNYGSVILDVSILNWSD